MTAWRTTVLVAVRELRARRKAAGIITLLTVLAAGAGIAVASLNSGPGGTPAVLSPEEADRIVGIGGTVILFMAIVFTGQVLLLGVAEEKNSRVVEVVLGAVRPRHLLTAKVVAIGLLGVIEVALAAVTVLVVGSLLDTIEIPSATGGAALAVLMWFVLGFAFYATVYAAAGALVGRHEHAANAALPINAVLIIGYMVGVSSAESVANPVLRLASLLPPVAPVTMPLRMIGGSAAAWEVVLAAALTIVSAYCLIRLAGRVYLGGVMRSSRVSWRNAFLAAERPQR